MSATMRQPDYHEATGPREREVWDVAFAAFRSTCAHRPAAEDFWASMRAHERRHYYDIAEVALLAAEAKFQDRLDDAEERMIALLTPANSNECGLPNHLLPGPDGRKR